MTNSTQTTSPEEIFTAFDSYSWAEDPRFITLVKTVAARGMAATTPGVILAMRISWAKSALKMNIDKAAYISWTIEKDPEYSVVGGLDGWLAATLGTAAAEEVKMEKEKKKGKDKEKEKERDKEAEENFVVVDERLEWQKAAPMGEGKVEKGEGQGQPPGAMAELLRFLQEGTPVPGIREIPETVVRDKNVTPFGRRVAPRKPWERGEQIGGEGQRQKTIDAEFPPLDG